MAIPLPPTGLYTTVFRNRVEVRWVKNPDNVKGYNVYNSTTSGGGVSGYAKLNNTLVEQYSEVKKDIVSTQTTVTEDGAERTTVINQTLQDVYIFLLTHDNLTEERVEYYVVTAVNELGEESPLSIEISATPLIIKTEIVEEPLRTQNDISLDYITTLLEREPNLDVKPGTITRQLHIDPNSREISNVYVRRDFVSRSQSLITLKALDDSDGDSISDLVADSTYKQLLKKSYFLQTDEEVQSMIDFAFDKIAGNSMTLRKPATKSRSTATFYTSTKPTVSITINSGEEISTVPSETKAAIKFVTLAQKIMDVNTIENYYNVSRQRYEIEVSIEAVDAGSVGNVNANTIINSSVAGLQVTNLIAAFNGTDRESNADLADRAMLAFVGLDVGTAAGYKKTVTKVPSVTDVKIVDAGHPLMQRDYDDVRGKHVYGKVDIYIKGGGAITQQESVGFLYKQSSEETMLIVDTADMIIRSQNSSLSVTNPIFTVREIKNVSKGKVYDLAGNWTIYKNSVIMQKVTEVNLSLSNGEIAFINPLVFGDVIVADYDYKTTIEGETVIDPASGGEVNFTLDFFPIVKRSYTIFINDAVLVENVDYTLNLINGFLQLATGLIAGDKLTANYQYLTRVTGEIVISSAAGDEATAFLVNPNVLESLLIGTDGITLDIEQTNVINNSIGMDVTDVIKATYRYRDSDPIILQMQPVDSIVSVESSISGSLVANVNYFFNKNDDILMEGNSVKSQRYIQIEYANEIPVGDLVKWNEDIVLINNTYKSLSRKGIDPASIIVKKGSILYAKNTDYLIRNEENGENVKIARSLNSSIPNGETVTVYYEYGELLTISYNVDPLIRQVQDEIEVVRHVTADVLVKGVLETKVDFDIGVVINRGSDEVVAASDIRTAITNEFAKKDLGVGVAQSDIIRVIEEVANVKSVLVPLTKMVKSDGVLINRERVGVPFTEYQQSVVKSYSTPEDSLLQKTLGSNAGDGFYAVFEDDRDMVLVTDPNDVDTAAGQAFISSNGEVFISTVHGDSPDSHRYTVSYVVNGESGAKDIDITDLDFLSIGEIVITTAYAE